MGMGMVDIGPKLVNDLGERGIYEVGNGGRGGTNSGKWIRYLPSLFLSKGKEKKKKYGKINDLSRLSRPPFCLGAFF